MIFFNQHQDVVDIDLHLLDKLNFKFNIIRDIFFFSFIFSTVLIIQVKVDALIILQIPCSNTVHFFKLIKGRKYISHTKDRAEQSDKIFLYLLSNDLSTKRIFCFQLFQQINITRMILTVVVLIAIPVIPKAL